MLQHWGKASPWGRRAARLRGVLLLVGWFSQNSLNDKRCDPGQRAADAAQLEHVAIKSVGRGENAASWAATGRPRANVTMDF